MKKLFLLIAFVSCLCIHGEAQTDFIPSDSCYWHIGTINWGSSYANKPYGSVGDTIINGNTYTKIGQSTITEWNIDSTVYYCSAREEDEKWYFIKKGDITEYMLYDFGAEVGDTISIYNPFAFFEYNVVVLDIDSILLGDKYRKQIHIDNDYPSGEIEHWIEGIGSTKGLFYSSLFIQDAGSKLNCFHHKGEEIYNNSTNGDCNYYPTSVAERASNLKISLSPNPSRSYLELSCEDRNLSPREIKVIDLLGRTIYVEAIGDWGYRLDTSQLDNGAYFLQIRLADSRIVIEKFLKQ